MICITHRSDLTSVLVKWGTQHHCITLITIDQGNPYLKSIFNPCKWSGIVFNVRDQMNQLTVIESIIVWKTLYTFHVVKVHAIFPFLIPHIHLCLVLILHSWNRTMRQTPVARNDRPAPIPKMTCLVVYSRSSRLAYIFRHAPSGHVEKHTPDSYFWNLLPDRSF